MTSSAFLKPCPFCGAGTTDIVPNGRVWTGMQWGEPTSVSVRHWCAEVPGQPSRMLERVGRDEASAIEAWNRRAVPEAQPVADERERCAMEVWYTLQRYLHEPDDDGVEHWLREAEQSIRARGAAPEAQPVDDGVCTWPYCGCQRVPTTGCAKGCTVQSAARERQAYVPPSDERIAQMMNARSLQNGNNDSPWWLLFARAVEAEVLRRAGVKA